MNPTTQASIQLADIYGLFSEYRRLIVTGTLCFMALFIMASYMIPKKFKVSFVMAIHSSYFQNPLTHDLMADIFDTSEMKSQRESLIRQSLSPEFVDSLGKKYGMYRSISSGGLVERFMSMLGRKKPIQPSIREMRARSMEREELMSRIDVLNINPDTFKISFLYSDPDVAFKVTQDIYAQVLRGLTTIRKNDLNALHSAIQKRLESLAASMPALDAATPGAAVAPVVVGPQKVDQELEDVRNELRVMTVRYTEEHPLIKELREREKALSELVGNSAAPQPIGALHQETPLSVQLPREALMEIYKDLTKKLNYLAVFLDSDQNSYIAILESPLYPAAPLWPKKGLFVLWGMAVGLAGTFFYAAIREYFHRAALHTTGLSEYLGIAMLGKLPVISWGLAREMYLQRVPVRE
jgi:hypothetical protein